jgi:hypothetical protein
MEIEFTLKLIGGIAAILAIAERIYCYSLKVYQNLKRISFAKRVQLRTNLYRLEPLCAKKIH